MSGTVASVGGEVKEWKAGDRVCVNFSPLHIYGDVDKQMIDAAYGAIVNGVLTEYKIVPANVSRQWFTGHILFLTLIRRWFQSPDICRLRRLPRSRGLNISSIVHW